MLAITPEATVLVGAIRDQQRLPDTYGLRLYAGASDDGQRALHIGFTEEPAAGDEVTEGEGARVFVASEIAPALSDMVLDVESSGEEPRLVLHRS